MPDDAAELSPEADDFFRTLPGDEYPQALVDHYPRIANTIVELRYDRPKLEKYFQSLLNDSRGGRQGFPFSVLMNLQSLHDVMVGGESGTTFWV
jgi:tankyrase